MQNVCEDGTWKMEKIRLEELKKSKNGNDLLSTEHKIEKKYTKK